MRKLFAFALMMCATMTVVAQTDKFCIAKDGKTATIVVDIYDWKGVIRAVRESLSVPVTANGGIFGAEDAARLREATGCTRLMVARGSIGNPWIFRELAQGSPAPPSHGELCDALERHISGMARCYGERTGMILGRKIATAYLHGRGYRKEYRIRGSQMASMADFQAMMADLRQEGPVAGPIIKSQ